MDPSMDTTAGQSSAPRQPTFLGHPIGLYVLFFTEMWERFSYYGMRALLMLYMVNYFKWPQKDASVVYKWYTSLVYLTPLLGGYLADRYLGNKRAVVIGALLMAAGQFLMTFEALPAFYSALVFLILGNGFFKPNMSTQVGRLYPANDARRDGAYTIFYMGINLGAFLSPLICGWLAENTMGGYHSGFAVAGVGMICALVIYLVGLRWVVELKSGPAIEEEKHFAPEKSEAVTTGEGSIQTATPPPIEELVQRDLVSGAGAGTGEEELPPSRPPISEAAAMAMPSVMPHLNRLAPRLMTCLGVIVGLCSPALAVLGVLAWNTVVALEIGAVCALISAWITSQVHQAVRDRVLAIYVLGVFVVFFWAAFEQAGNALNIWADKISDRYLTTPMQPPSIYPTVQEVGESKTATLQNTGFLDRWINMFRPIPKAKTEAAGWSWSSLFNPVPTAWFQSINALAIFLLAPVFAVLWTWLDRRGWNPSIPTKMAFGVVLMASAFAVMIGAAKQEDGLTSEPLQGGVLPWKFDVNSQGQVVPAGHGLAKEPYLAGRLTYNERAKTLHLRGVLPDLDRDSIVRETARPAFVEQVEELQAKTQEGEAGKIKAQVKLDPVPPGFDLRYAGFSKKALNFDPQTHILTATVPLADKDVKAILVAGGDPDFRATLDQLMVDSSQHRVSSAWLFWFYILATLGELCLSPVGLSMVSKLAPAKFATMLMGMWLLTSFFGGFAAGAFGEIWGTVAPTQYFIIFLAALAGAAVVLFLLVRKIVAMMHGVN